MEAVSRAVSVSASRSRVGFSHHGKGSKGSALKLAALLASMAMFELRFRPAVFSTNSEGTSCTVGASVLLRYLQVCAVHLPRPARPLSLFAEDHLTASMTPPMDNDVSQPVEVYKYAVEPLLGHVLVSVLGATAIGTEGSANDASWEAVCAVVLHGYECRPLCALAAVAIEGVSVSLVSGRQARRASRQQRRGGTGADDGKVFAASRALCVAATFVRATAEAVSAVDGIKVDGSTFEARDLVAAFPAALLAVASDNKVR